MRQAACNAGSPTTCREPCGRSSTAGAARYTSSPHRSATTQKTEFSGQAKGAGGNAAGVNAAYHAQTVPRKQWRANQVRPSETRPCAAKEQRPFARRKVIKSPTATKKTIFPGTYGKRRASDARCRSLREPTQVCLLHERHPSA